MFFWEIPDREIINYSIIGKIIKRALNDVPRLFSSITIYHDIEARIKNIYLMVIVIAN